MRYRIDYGKSTNVMGKITFLGSVGFFVLSLFGSHDTDRFTAIPFTFALMIFTFLLILPLYSFKLGYIEVNDTAFIKHTWPFTRTLHWSEIKAAERKHFNRGEPFLIGIRHDGTRTRRISVALESKPESDWWAEIVRQMDAHGIDHPGIDTASGRPHTSLDIDLKTGEIKRVSNGKIMD